MFTPTKEEIALREKTRRDVLGEREALNKVLNDFREIERTRAFSAFGYKTINVKTVARTMPWKWIIFGRKLRVVQMILKTFGSSADHVTSELRLRLLE